MASVVLLTTLHPRTDARICVKEARTLATYLPHNVILVVADGEGHANDGHDRGSIHDLGHFAGGRIGRMIQGPWRALLFIHRMKPYIVHFHDPELIPLGLFLKMIGYKVIYDVHEDVPRQTLSKQWLPWIIRKPVACSMSVIEWFGAKVFDAVVPATPKIAERFPADKTITLQNFPIAAEMFNPAGIPYAERPTSFAYIGVITRTRGAAEIVSALKFLNDISTTKLDLVGTIYPQDLVDTLRALPCWSSVNYHGQVSRKQVSYLLQYARAGLVLFHPLPNHIDAQPNKMFEYMSAGLPVIASDFPLWRRIIEGAECGLLVDPLDPKAIAEAMRWILEHPVEAEAMGKRGRRAVEEIYNWDAEAPKLIDLYNKLFAS